MALRTTLRVERSRGTVRSMGKLPRFWCRYDELEEWRAGMWRRVAGEVERAQLLAEAVAHLRDQKAFCAAMLRVLSEWPTSCLAAFTTPSLNKPVWLAHAGAALMKGIPEEFMRLGYWELEIPERERADHDAITCAAEWRDPRGT